MYDELTPLVQLRSRDGWLQNNHNNSLYILTYFYTPIRSRNNLPQLPQTYASYFIILWVWSNLRILSIQSVSETTHGSELLIGLQWSLDSEDLPPAQMRSHLVSHLVTWHSIA